MRKIVTLAVAACMVLGSFGAAAAVDVKVGGQWYFHYGYYSNNMLSEKSDTGKHTDRTRARQRVRTQISFIADENLSAMLNLEANMNWGSSDDSSGNSGYGAIDADHATFVIKRAHLDWIIPQTQVKTRMGIQGINLPTVAFGNPVLNADVAGISVSAALTPSVGITGFWARPYDRSFDSTDQDRGQNSMDEMDVFGVVLPIKTDVVRMSPWATFALIGKDSEFFTDTKGYNYMHGKRSPATQGRVDDLDGTSYGWWAGMTFELPILDPFFVKLDAMMGGLETGESDYDTFGWMVAGDIGYKFSFGSLSVLGWYASGDKDEDDLGQMPYISDDDGSFAPTRYATAGTTARSYDKLLTGNGIGMWGIGLKLADVSFVENLKHTLIGMYMGGTNKADSVNRRSVRDSVGDKYFGQGYLTTSDRAYEIDLLNEYKVNENLMFNVDFAYVWLDLGDHWTDNDDTTGSFATMIGVTYSF